MESDDTCAKSKEGDDEGGACRYADIFLSFRIGLGVKVSLIEASVYEEAKFCFFGIGAVKIFVVFFASKDFGRI